MKNRIVGSVGIVALFAGFLLFGHPPVRAGDAPCEDCGPGPHWVDNCVAGQDAVSNSGAVVGIDADLDSNCTIDFNLIMVPCGAPDDKLLINRSGPLDQSAFFPGIGTNDGHLDVIDTEIISMCLVGGGVTLKAGLGSGSGVIFPSNGVIEENSVDPNKALSFFDVFFEVSGPVPGGGPLYNHEPLRIQADPDITCVPPKANYFHPTGICIDLWDDPNPGQGTVWARLVEAEHMVNPDTTNSTESESWGGIKNMFR